MENVYTKSGALAKRIYFGATLIWNKVAYLYELFKQRVLSDGGTFIENPIIFGNESLLLTPNAFKVGKLYSALPTNGTGDFTVDRNSTATYIGQDGLIETALANVPRIDWGTGEAALLVEPQSTNFFLASDPLVDPNIAEVDNVSFDANDWGIGLTGKVIFSDNLVNTRRYRVSQALSEDITYTLSGLVKPYNGVKPSFIIFGGIGFLTIGGVALSNVNVRFTQWEGIYYVEGSGKINPSYPTLNGFRKDNTNNSIGFELSSIQLEQASTGSSYIPTNGTTVTRLEDDISVPTPAGVTSITETIDGVEQNPITTIPATYSLPVGNINKVTMI